MGLRCGARLWGQVIVLLNWARFGVKLLARYESRLGFHMGLVWAKMWGTVRRQGGSSGVIYILIWINPALSMGQFSGLGRWG